MDALSNKTKTLAFVALMLFAAGCATQQETSSETAQEGNATKPNIIYIMADDLGYADVGCYGQEIIQTPNIDGLAAEGIRFTQHYAGTSVCAPSRCVLMTGKHMGHAEVRGNKQWEPSGQMPISPETVTVAELLKAEGYTTGMIGKWGLGESETEGNPNEQGFDFFYGYTDQVLAHNYWPEFLVRNGEKVYLENEVKYLDSTAWHGGLGSYSTKKVAYSNDLFTVEALRFMEENQAKPFFLYLPYTIPHNNGEALPGLKQEVPDYGRFDSLDWESDTKGYAAMIERLDGYVGQIRQKVEELGLSENTIILFTSDNGPMQEDRHAHTLFFDSNGPLRGGKRDLYEGGIRVPMVAYWPGTIAPGSVTDHPSVFYDFLPTALDIAGAGQMPETDGISYLPAMQGKMQPIHDFMYWEFYEGGKSQAIRRGNWKAVRNNVFANPDAPIELYNLVEDLGEQNDVAAAHPDVVAELTALMQKAHETDPQWPLFNTEAAE